MKFKLPKRCPFCARKLDANGKCVNKDCIAYVPRKKPRTPRKPIPIMPMGRGALNDHTGLCPQC